MPVLSLCMIVKNEEKFLRDCLESVKSVVDEIVIVDTGSFDKTIDIANEYKAKVFPFEWTNNFSAARNYALSYCTGNWILYLDADERFSEKSVDELKRFIGKEDKIGVKCIVKSVESGYSRDNAMRYTRLFRNIPQVEFTGRVHEQIDPSLLKLNYKFVNSNIEIIHLGYNISQEARKEKAKRNLELLIHEYAENNSSYIAFQLAQTYNILDDNENAEKYSIVAVDGKVLNAQQKAISYGLLSNNELKRHKTDSAIYYIKEALKWDNNQPYLNLLASKIYLRLQDYLNAEEYCRRAFEANTRLLSGSNFSALDIILNEEEIIYYGIGLAKISKTQRYYNLYLNAVKKFYEKKGTVNSENILAVLRKIYSDENLNEGDVETIISLINKGNLCYFLEILKSYKVSESRLKILGKLTNEFINDLSFASLFGITLADNNLVNQAIRVLESVACSKKAEPSTLFYLISLYVKENDLNKITACLNMLESDYSNIPEVKSRIPLLKQKLGTLDQM